MFQLLVIIALFTGNAMNMPLEDTSSAPPVDGTILSDPNPKADIIKSKMTLVNLVPTRPFGRDHGILEVPTWFQKTDSIYDYAQHFVANILKPKPIVDTISEKDKYGNTGDSFRPIGNAIVNGYEGFANFLNGVVELPLESAKQVTRAATAYLSNIGAKLVGL